MTRTVEAQIPTGYASQWELVIVSLIQSGRSEYLGQEKEKLLC
jgi:hypothetical protein